jgi:hypothetical protein
MSLTCSKCDAEHERVGQRYCRPCQTAYAREWRKTTKKSEEAKKRDSARSYCHTHEKRGYLHRSPCCVCGSEQTELHHPDYDRPLYVFSLCREHHAAWHSLERANPDADFLKWLPIGSAPAFIGPDPSAMSHEMKASFINRPHPRS